ncbi:MAG: hypothetical protein IPH86_08400 [bacterium]|nr:hypothetical protein [bacterium]
MIITTSQAARGPDDAIALQAMVDLAILHPHGASSRWREFGRAAVAAVQRSAGDAAPEDPLRR